MVEVLLFPAPHLVRFTASVCPRLQTGMSAVVPLIANPRDQFLDALPFVHAHARNQCINAIRRAFDHTTMEQKSLQVMLHLSTRNGPTLMEMVACVVRGQSELCVIFMGGEEVDSSLVGLLHAEGLVTGSAVPLSKPNDDDHLRPISEGLHHAEGSVTGSADPLSKPNDDDHLRPISEGGLHHAEGSVTGSAVPLSKSNYDDHLRPISEGLHHAEGSVTGSAVPLSKSNDDDHLRPIPEGLHQGSAVPLSESNDGEDHFRQDGCQTNLTVDEKDSMTSLPTNPQMHHNDNDDEIELKMSSLTIVSSGSVGSAAREINFMLGFTSGMG